ncbi:inovirus Gp2 family protein [Aeromonas salmonicida]|uniref:inovirus Gp2 family protein n=1 Tax=Aeromonas salmonicida TaxID=645 RepID=UPI00259F35FB|nr:inovirus Gp2 family protein [Aeromonas salmonicida]MDM5065603.1 inovirus Gp2 family protein [Aeromonas salmonicida]
MPYSWKVNIPMNANSVYEMNATEVAELLRQVKVMYGDIHVPYLIRSLAVVDSTLKKWSRVFAIRVDVRFAKVNSGCDIFHPTRFQRTDSQVITRFIESLKSQLREVSKRKRRRYISSEVRYIWVREQDTGDHPHYHLVLFFNKDRYTTLGNYTKPDGINMATRLQKAWCSALGLPFPEYAGLVHFPKNCEYIFDRKEVLLRSSGYMKFLNRIAYFSKVRTKLVGDGQRNFGCSQVR